MSVPASPLENKLGFFHDILAVVDTDVAIQLLHRCILVVLLCLERADVLLLLGVGCLSRKIVWGRRWANHGMYLLRCDSMNVDFLLSAPPPSICVLI